MNGSITKSVMSLLSGSLLSQIVYLVATPIISRMYDVDSIGQANVFISVSAILVPMFAMGYHFATVVCKNPSEAKKLKLISYILSAFVFIFFLMMTLIYIYFDFNILSSSNSYNHFYISVLALATAIVGIETQYSLRNEKFKLIAKSLFICTLSTALLKMLLVKFINQVDAFLIAIIIGLSIQVIILRGRSDLSIINYKNAFEFKEILVSYNRFPKYIMPQTMIAMINLHSPVFVMSMLYDSIVVSHFVMARAIMMLPITFIAQNVGDVLFSKFSQKINNNEPTQNLLMQSVLIMLVISSFAALTIYLFGPWLFSTFLGDRWETSGEYAGWLTLWFMFNFINRPFVALTSPLKLDRALLMNGIATMVLVLLVFIIAGELNFQVQSTLLIYSLATVIPQSFFMMYIFNKSRVGDLL